MNTWCHGAPGILLSRIKLGKLEEFKENKQVAMDMERASRALYQRKKLSGLCICHGATGNAWIKKIYQKEKGEFSLEPFLESFLEKKLAELAHEIQERDDDLPQERYNPGLMTGLAGIGAVLCDFLD